MDAEENVRLRELLDKHAIYDVLARYVRAIDRGDSTLLRSVFHTDAIDVHSTGTEMSADDFCGAAMDIIGRMGPTAHYLSFPLIELQGDLALSECYGIAFHRLERAGEKIDSVFGARVLDRFERRDGVWKIARRRVIYDWNRDAISCETWGRGFFGDGIRAEGSKGIQDPLYELLPRSPYAVR